jgi:[ribosomal protein S5]-alanine N-acetyltransferase
MSIFVSKSFITVPTIETPRLVLKPMETKFITKDYLHWMNDLDVCKFLETSIPYSEVELQDFVYSMITNKILFWAITIKHNGLHIGNIKIDPINKKHLIGEYGILMGDRNNWGRGFAKEASQAVISYCFESLYLRKITLGVIKDNIAAVKLYESLGFEVEGIYRMHGKYDEKYCDAIRMALFNGNNPEVQNYFDKKH